MLLYRLHSIISLPVKRYFVVALWMGMACLNFEIHAGTGALVENGVDWGASYYAPSSEESPQKDGLPDDAGRTVPLWTIKDDAEPGTLTLETDSLQIDTAASGNYTCYITPFGSESSDAATVEFVVQVAATEDGSYYAGGIYAGLGNYAWSLQFGTGKEYVLQWGGKNYSAEELGGLDLTQTTTFRIVMENMISPEASVSLYINHAEKPLLVLKAENMVTPAYSQTLQFGQTADRANQAGIVLWKGIRWNPAEAIPPSSHTPSPSS